MTRPAVPSPGALIAVTGGTGFLGSHVCDGLLAAGHRVRTSARPASDPRWLRDKPVEILTCALDDPAAIDALLAGCEGVVHCAGAIAAPTEAVYQRINVGLTRALLEGSARAAGVRAFVLISSLAAAGPAGPETPRTEEMPCAPITAYGRSKRDAETLVHGTTWPFRTVSLRPPALYGPRDREFLPLFKAARLGWTGRLGRELRGLSLVEGTDCAAAALALLATASATGPYFVDDGPGPDQRESLGRRFAWGHPWEEIFAALDTVWRRRLHRAQIPLAPLRLLAALQLPGRTPSPVLHPDRLRDLAVAGWVCSAARLRRDTGWLPRHDLPGGFQATRDFLTRAGWL
jgi:nucleoside-diphosphate-sugar epimerase